MLTYEQALKSEPLRDIVNQHLQDKNFLLFLSAIQNKALPSRDKRPAVEHLPGAHPDTSVAHNAFYWQGWSDSIKEIQAFPTGQSVIENTEEEMFAHAAQVQEIDKEIQARKENR